MSAQERTTPGVRYLVSQAPVHVPLEDVEKASRDGWAWADEVPGTSVPAGAAVVRIDPQDGSKRVVAVLKLPRDMKSVMEVARRYAERPVEAVTRSVQVEDIVGVAQLAERLKVGISTIRSWRARYSDFPGPIASFGSQAVWSWAEVETWVAQRKKYERRTLRPRVVTLD